jgi:hypothetical protein
MNIWRPLFTVSVHDITRQRDFAGTVIAGNSVAALAPRAVNKR